MVLVVPVVLAALVVLAGRLEALEVRVDKRRVLGVEKSFVDSGALQVYLDLRFRVYW